MMEEKACCHEKPTNLSPDFVQKFREKLVSYKPLLVILIFCLIIPLAQIHLFEQSKYMYYFMGYFFIFLSLFKFFDLKGFVSGFTTYDLVSKKSPVYAYMYPFIEFLLGIAYLTQFNLVLTDLVTVVVMFLSGVGVVKSIFSGEKIKCACLGTALNVPLGSISILENFGMGAMAAYQLSIHFFSY